MTQRTRIETATALTSALASHIRNVARTPEGRARLLDVHGVPANSAEIDRVLGHLVEGGR